MNYILQKSITFFANVKIKLANVKITFAKWLYIPTNRRRINSNQNAFYLQLNESIQMKIGVNTAFIEIKSSFNNI